MAYTSDFRIKNIIKEVHQEIINSLKNEGILSFPTLRIFEESNEDSILYANGGLTFDHPETKLKFGSNDAAWIFNNKPLVVVEGTFGTERGQFGDGQLNRFSHSAGVAINDFIGITLLPFRGESYSTDGTILEGINNRIRIKYASVHKGFIKGALTLSKIESGKFLVLDIYDLVTLKKLVIEKFKFELKKENQLPETIAVIEKTMELEIQGFEYAEKSNQFLTKLYDTDDTLLSTFSRYYTQNYEALTTSEKRDGHGLFGKNLVESYLSGDQIYYSIFIRLDKDDIKNLKLRRQKEFTFISNSKKINVKCIDDLEFSSKLLEDKVRGIKKLNLFKYRQNDLMKELQKAFIDKNVRIKK